MFGSIETHRFGSCKPATSRTTGSRCFSRPTGPARRLSAWCRCRRRPAPRFQAGCGIGTRTLEHLRERQCRSPGRSRTRGRDLPRSGMSFSTRTRRTRVAGVVDDAAGSAAAVVRAAFVARTDSRLLAGPRVRCADASKRFRRRLAQANCADDTAATSCAQTTRLPGFVNHKRETPVTVSIDYLRPSCRVRAGGFSRSRARSASRTSRRASRNVVKRGASRRSCGWNAPVGFFGRSSLPLPGQHGDLRTFRICCRLVRGSRFQTTKRSRS